MPSGILVKGIKAKVVYEGDFIVVREKLLISVNVKT
jgi:hypothetical protein